MELDLVVGWAKENGAGHMSLGPTARHEAEEASGRNREWLEDCAVHLLCVLALDRFADFISDQVGQNMIVVLLSH